MVLDGLLLLGRRAAPRASARVGRGTRRDPSSILSRAGCCLLHSGGDASGCGFQCLGPRSGVASSRGSGRRTPPRPSCPAARPHRRPRVPRSPSGGRPPRSGGRRVVSPAARPPPAIPGRTPPRVDGPGRRAPRRSGSDRPRRSGPWRPRRCCDDDRPCNLDRHSSPGSSASRGTSAMGRKQTGAARRRAWPGPPGSRPGRRHPGVATRGTRSRSSHHSGRRTLPRRPDPTGCRPRRKSKLTLVIEPSDSGMIVSWIKMVIHPTGSYRDVALFRPSPDFIGCTRPSNTRVAGQDRTFLPDSSS